MCPCVIKNHRGNQSKATDELSFINAPANSNITAEKIRDPGIYVEDWAHCLGEEGMRGLTDDLTSEDQMDGWTPHRCLWYGGAPCTSTFIWDICPTNRSKVFFSNSIRVLKTNNTWGQGLSNVFLQMERGKDKPLPFRIHLKSTHAHVADWKSCNASNYTLDIVAVHLG